MVQRNNMSASTKFIVRDKSSVPLQNATPSYNFATPADKRKRIYSAKPALQDSRKFTQIKNRYFQEPNIMQMSPSGKKLGDSSFVKFTTQTAPSTDFQKSFYNPYQTVTKISDNFLNIEKAALPQGITRSTARSTESSLSNFTQVQNCKTLSQLQALENIREKSSIANELANLKHIDCKKLLMSANTQLKKINYRLNNLISNGETHVEVTRNDPKEFEILDGIPLFIKVGCRNLVGPAKFILKHITKGKVKSYVSTKPSVPPTYRSGK
jgi:hypothetical protein